MKNLRLIELRAKHGLSQQELALAIGVSQSMLARIEAGKREPRKHIKQKLARYFNVSVEWLFYEAVNDQQTYAQPTGTEGR